MTAQLIQPVFGDRQIDGGIDIETVALKHPQWAAGFLRGMATYRRMHADGMRSGPLALAGADRHDQVAERYELAAIEVARYPAA